MKANPCEPEKTEAAEHPLITEARTNRPDQYGFDLLSYSALGAIDGATTFANVNDGMEYIKSTLAALEQARTIMRERMKGAK